VRTFLSWDAQRDRYEGRLRAPQRRARLLEAQATDPPATLRVVADAKNIEGFHVFPLHEIGPGKFVELWERTVDQPIYDPDMAEYVMMVREGMLFFRTAYCTAGEGQTTPHLVAEQFLLVPMPLEECRLPRGGGQVAGPHPRQLLHTETRDVLRDLWLRSLGVCRPPVADLHVVLLVTVAHPTRGLVHSVEVVPRSCIPPGSRRGSTLREEIERRLSAVVDVASSARPHDRVLLGRLLTATRRDWDILRFTGRMRLGDTPCLIDARNTLVRLADWQQLDPFAPGNRA